MIKTIDLQPNITLRCYTDRRFKQGNLSIQFIRKMTREEAALNALLPAVLLRGSKNCPDMRQIIRRLDDLYGASVGALVRRIGDYQTTGFSCSFIDDRFAMAEDRVLVPMVAFVGELLTEPKLEKGVFCEEYVRGEKENLVLTIESQRNDKRAYAAGQLMKHMCGDDSYSINRLGEVEQVEAITPQSLYTHYQKILRESPVEIFYIGATQPETVADALKTVFKGIGEDAKPLPPQTPLCPGEEGSHEEAMEVAQGKLAMGFVTPVTVESPSFAAMQVFNTLFGAGMVSKLFMKIREEMSLCYDIGSGYYGTKGVVTVSAGIDFDKKEAVQQEVLRQLEACVAGDFSQLELSAAKESVISGLQAVHDAPSSIEGYYAVAALNGLNRTPEEYIRQVRQVEAADVVAAAASLTLHTVYFLKGVQ